MTKTESIKTIPTNRLKFFPIMMFAIVMGLAGLTIVYENMAQVFSFPTILANIMIGFVSIVYVLIVSFYLVKIFKYKEEVKKELSHPIRINFFAASSIATLLVSIVYKHYLPSLSYILFVIGAGLHIYFTFYTIKYWINNSIEIQHSNPAWFIPIVGNLIVPIAGSTFVSNSILYFYFSIGIFFWIILFAIILNRVIFHNPFVAKFMPTLFILIAPPAIGFVSYIKLTNSLDFFAHTLFSLGLFFTILVFVMYKNFIKIKFFISWWAFTFPMTAVTLSSILMYKLTAMAFYEILSYILTFLSTVIIFLVLKETISHIKKQEICIME